MFIWNIIFIITKISGYYGRILYNFSTINNNNYNNL